MALMFIGTLFIYGVFKRKTDILEALLEKYIAEHTKLYSVSKKLYYENRELTARVSALERSVNVQYNTVETQVSSPSSSYSVDSNDTGTSSRKPRDKKQLWPFNVVM